MQDRPELLDVARRAYDWIDSVAVEADGGLGWLETRERVDDLYAGTAGILLGCAEATAAGLDPVRAAAGARGRLLHLARHDPETSTIPDDGVFTGWAGVATALRSWASVAGDAEAADGADLVTAQLAERILATPPDRSRYTDVISGAAGILLTLLDDPSDVAVRAANVLADHLVGMAEPTAEGPQWRMVADQESLMPGFSHGTAGVAYALAAAGRTLHRSDLLDMAIRGADTLLAVGDRSDGWVLPPVMPVRPDDSAHYGWCHGPTGTVRLFVLLHGIEPQPRWQHAIDACVKALRDSRLPLRLYPGYWDNVARCCGTAGVGQLLLDRYQATGDTALLDWADTLAADVVDRAVASPYGITWSNTEHTVSPPDLAPEPGFMQGAAGIAGWLARLHTLRTEPTAARPAPLWL